MRTTPSSPRLKFFPVVVGVDRYRAGQDLRLDYAVLDAQRIAEFLRAGNTAFEAVPFKPLLNEEATSERIRPALRALWGSHRHSPGDVLMFYFAGHCDVVHSQGFLFCHDVNPREPSTGGLRLDEIYSDMQALQAEYGQAETVMVILDACRSGSFIDPRIVNQNPTLQMRSLLAGTLPQTTGNRIILAAASVNQAARESGTNNGEGGGHFTTTLLRGWRDGQAQRDGTVTPESLTSYIRRTFSEDPAQQPVTVIAGATELVLGRFDQGLSASPSVPLNQPVVLPRSVGSPGAGYNPDNSRMPVASNPQLPPEVRRRIPIVALGITIVILAALGLLVALSPLAFGVGVGVAFLLALISIPLAGRYGCGAGGLVAVVSVIQFALLIGALDLRFGLGRDITPIDAVAHYAWLAPIIFLVEAVFVMIDFYGRQF